MSQDFETKQPSFCKMTKKISKKGNVQIPLDALGFKAKVFYDSAYEFVPRKKQNKYAKYEKEKRQNNFRSKLSCIIDPSHATYEQIGDMKFNKRAEWKKIKYVVFRTKQLLTCCICLSKQFTAPQMTFCGHVFCWHCLLMHYEKSLKANSCPVCNQIFEIQELRTCQNLYLPPVSHGQRIRLKLKMRKSDEKITYDPESFQQQTAFSNIIRMKSSATLHKFIEEHEQILREMKKNEDAQIQKYLSKVLERSQQKIDEQKKIIQQQKSHHYKSHKHQNFVNGVLCQILPAQQLATDKLMTFYQEQQGRYVYLHPICEKYLRKNYNNSTPLRIQEEILLKEETQFSGQNLKKYKYLNHLPDNQDFDFVFIKMNELIDYKLLQQFYKQFELYKKRKQQVLEREEEYARLLNQKYEKQQQYMRELKKMEQSEFHDIKVPSNMVDLSQIQDANIFPSLVSNSSQNSDSPKFQIDKVSEVQSSSPIFGKSKKSKKEKFQIKEEDFPGLELAIKMSMDQSPSKETQLQENLTRALSQSPVTKQMKISKTQQDFPEILSSKNSQQVKTVKSKKKIEDDEQEESAVKRKGKKKNKQKFVDMTHHFFHRQQEQ